MLTNPAGIVALLALLAMALIPASIMYYLWLAKHVAPCLVALPTRLAISVLALWVALPWVLGATVLWLARG